MSEKVKEQINYEALSLEELTEISRHDHQDDVRQYDKQQNAFCLVMIGAICLVCGILFLILSSVREKNITTGIDPTCLPFFVSIGCFVASVVLLALGLTRFFIAFFKRKALKEEIIVVTRLKSSKMSSN